MSYPNQVAEAVLIRDFQDGVETFRVMVRVQPGKVSKLKAVTALKSGCILAMERVIRGEFGLEVEALSFQVAHERG